MNSITENQDDVSIEKMLLKRSNKQPVKKAGHSADALIDAYFIGLEKGKRFIVDSESKLFSLNIKKVAKPVYEIIDTIKKKFNFSVDRIYLKINGYDSLEVLIEIDEEIFVDEKFSEIYETLFDFTEELDKEDVELELKFLPTNKKIDPHAMRLHGFEKITVG